MEQRMKSMSLRQFRERAAEIAEPIEIVIRDLDGNFRVLGYFTPYVTHPPGAVELPPNTTGKMPKVRVTVGDEDVTDKVEFKTLDLPGVPRVISTPEEAAAAAPSSVRAFPKSAQTGRKGPNATSNRRR